MAKENAPTRIILIGTSAEHESIVRRMLGHGDDDGPISLRGFGSFSMALAALKEATPRPDFIQVCNFTCIPPSDLERGCKELCGVMAGWDRKPMIIISDRDLEYLAPLAFGSASVDLYIGSLMGALYNEVEIEFVPARMRA